MSDQASKHSNQSTDQFSHVAEPYSLKKQQVFTTQEVNVTAENLSIKGAQRFESASQFKDIEIERTLEGAIAKHSQEFDEPTLKVSQSRRFSWLARLSLSGLMLLVVVQTLLGLRDAWLESPWLFGFYGTVLALVSLWAMGGALSEYRNLKRLKQVEDTQATGARLALSMQMGEADGFIKNIVRHYPQSQGVEKLKRSLKDEHNDAEKVMLFEDLVLTERDDIAKKVVRRYAAESAVLLAASPLAALDMAIILWRNQRMLRDVAKCYGIELGYWSRIKLIRSIVVNIIYAGSSELVTDIGTQLLSVEMTGKVSARLAQGLGGGLLTARLGYQAMALCRPIRFSEDKRPKLSKIHQELLTELKQFAGKLLTKDGRDVLKGQLDASVVETELSSKDKQ
ncbi:YcjF family protein [Shewanella sp. A25]|nr:YcjF family protein [Shewanella shenzhenensis]